MLKKWFGFSGQVHESSGEERGRRKEMQSAKPKWETLSELAELRLNLIVQCREVVSAQISLEKYVLPSCNLAKKSFLLLHSHSILLKRYLLKQNCIDIFPFFINKRYTNLYFRPLINTRYVDATANNLAKAKRKVSFAFFSLHSFLLDKNIVFLH